MCHNIGVSRVSYFFASLRTWFIKGKPGVTNTQDFGQWKDTNKYIKPVEAKKRSEAAKSQPFAIEQ